MSYFSPNPEELEKAQQSSASGSAAAPQQQSSRRVPDISVSNSDDSDNTAISPSRSLEGREQGEAGEGDNAKNGQTSRKVQWSEEPPVVEGDVTEAEHLAVDEDQALADLRRTLEAAASPAMSPMAGHQLPEDPVQAGGSFRLNLEGRDSEMIIPEGETEGLPSLAARQAAAAEQSSAARLFGSILGRLRSSSSQIDVEKQGDSASEQSKQAEDYFAPSSRPGPTSPSAQPMSVLGALMALKEADEDHSGASTPAMSTMSLPLSEKAVDEKDETVYTAPSSEVPSGTATPRVSESPERMEQAQAVAQAQAEAAAQAGVPAPGMGHQTAPSKGSEASTLVPPSRRSSGFSSGLGALSLKGHPAFAIQKGAKAMAGFAHSAVSSPGGMLRSGFHAVNVKDKLKRESAAEKKRRRKERKRQEIVQHLAALIERQEFLLKLTRALMMFGSPSHRLELLIQVTGNFLECPVQCMFSPGIMTLSFSDPNTRTSDTKFIKQGQGLDLLRLPKAQHVYSEVLHGKMTVKEASAELDRIMLDKPTWNTPTIIFIGMLASGFITPLAFGGSFVDTCGAMILGGILVTTQMVVAKSNLYANIFEIMISALNSFLASALAKSGYFCYSAVVTGSLVMILPGFIVLTGSLELTARNISAGSVRMFYAIIYALLLGFGIALGTEFWYLITNDNEASQDCSAIQSPGDGSYVPWYLRAAPVYYYILFAPMFQLMLALRNGASFKQRDTVWMILIGSAGYTVNYFCSHNDRFGGRADFSSAFGSFTCGILGNLYGRITGRSAFVVMAPGILFQLPSGFGQNGLLAFASTTANATATTSAGTSISQNLISIANGLTVGLFFSSALINPSSSSRRKQAAAFAF